ncbi:MAG TPA: transposase, partial [Ferruginibacter sp.]|nr:transposase [Ferruginibacter sp.]
MKQYTHFFGVDISKRTIDITLALDDQFKHCQFTNDDDGMNELKTWLKETRSRYESILFCMEATGLYCFPLTQFLALNGIDIWVEHPMQIKKSMALARGKNDKLDSHRIAQYAIKHLDRLRLWKPANTTLEKIRHLSTLRDR